MPKIIALHTSIHTASSAPFVLSDTLTIISWICTQQLIGSPEMESVITKIWNGHVFKGLP